jgi:hypothetical protein
MSRPEVQRKLKVFWELVVEAYAVEGAQVRRRLEKAAKADTATGQAPQKVGRPVLQLPERGHRS